MPSCSHVGTHRVWMARSEVKVPLARLWILLSYSESSERFCRSWKASARTQLILLALRSLAEREGSDANSVSFYYATTHSTKGIPTECPTRALQQLQGKKSPEDALGEVGDLVAIQHPKEEGWQQEDRWQWHGAVPSGCPLCPQCEHSQRVERAQTLEGVGGDLRDLVVAQISETQREKVG